MAGRLVGDVVPIMRMNLAWPGREGVVRGFCYLGMERGREGRGRERETDLD